MGTNPIRVFLLLYFSFFFSIYGGIGPIHTANAVKDPLVGLEAGYQWDNGTIYTKEGSKLVFELEGRGQNNR